MPSTFVREKPLQALKLAAVVGSFLFVVAAIFGVLPGDELHGLLYLAFFPAVLALVVGAETLLAAYRLARTDDAVSRLTARGGYTAIRVLEVVVTVLAPGIFYALIVRVGSDVAGPGAIGLLFIGIALGLLAYGAVTLRTLAEYYYHRRRFSSPTPDEHGGDVAK